MCNEDVNQNNKIASLLEVLNSVTPVAKYREYIFSLLSALQKLDISFFSLGIQKQFTGKRGRDDSFLI